MKSQLHLPTPLSTDSTDIVASPLLKAATLRIFLSRTLPDRPQHPFGLPRPDGGWSGSAVGNSGGQCSEGRGASGGSYGGDGLSFSVTWASAEAGAGVGGRPAYDSDGVRGWLRLAKDSAMHCAAAKSSLEGTAAGVIGGIGSGGSWSGRWGGWGIIGD